MMNNALISRKALMQFPIRRDHYDRENGSEEFISGIETVLEYAESLPAVDAAPVVHGRWENIANYGCGNCYGYCSECRSEVRAENATALKMANKYCHNCGAKMDKEG